MGKSEAPTKRVALIDADIIMYRAAMTAEYTVYMDPVNAGFAWRLKKLVPEECRDRLISLTVVEDVVKAVEAFRGMLSAAIAATNATHVILFLSPDATFRHRAAKTLPYKGNRAERAQPMYKTFIRKMMMENYGAIVCDDIEADDALGIMQTHFKETGVSSVICSDDKDLKMIPGDHYNIRTHEQELISIKEGNRKFALQLLTGDSTDNIQGLTRVGPKTAEKILKDVEPADRVKVIMGKYTKQFKEKGKARFKENVTLLRILKKVPEGQKTAFYNKPLAISEINLAASEAADGFAAQ